MKISGPALALLLAATPVLAQQGIDPLAPARQDQLSLVPYQDVVMAVEQRLQKLGYAIQPDGQFDADLRNSIIHYQSNNGLRPTGNVDLSTLASMGIDVGVDGQATAMAPQPQHPQQTAMAPAQAAPAQTIQVDWTYPIFRDEFMDAPQIAGEDQFQLVTGVLEPWNILLSTPAEPGEVAQIPGTPAGAFD